MKKSLFASSVLGLVIGLSSTAFAANKMEVKTTKVNTKVEAKKIAAKPVLKMTSKITKVKTESHKK